MPDENIEKQNASLNSVFSIGLAFALVAILVGGLSYSQGRLAERKDLVQLSGDSDSLAALDLLAQQAMADSTFWMSILALFTLLVTGLGTFFLAWQVSLTRKAVLETADATKAMERQNELAEQSLYGSERPYIFIDGIVAQNHITRECFDPENITLFDAFYTIKNYGRTPAIVSEFCGQIFIGDELPAAPEYHPPDIRGDEHSMVLGSNESAQPGAFYRYPITPELVNDLFCSRIHSDDRKPTRCYLFGYVNYSSFQGRSYEEGFIWEYLVDVEYFIRRDIPGYTFRRTSADSGSVVDDE